VQLLSDAQVRVAVVEHRDRLARCGAEYIEAALVVSGRRVVIVDPSEMTDDLVQDMLEVMTSLCARLYDRRAALHRATQGVAAAMADQPC
jgi:putative resolvase